MKQRDGETMGNAFSSFTNNTKPKNNKRNGENMKTIFTSMLAIAALVAALLVSPVQAALTGTVTVTVTLAGASVSVTDATIAIGTAGTPATMSTTYNSAAAIHVTNDTSPGIAQTYSLNLTNPATWTAGNPANADEYRLSALFNTLTGGTFDANDYVLSGAAVPCDGTKFQGDESGLNVAAAGIRHLWLKFETPASTTTLVAQVITITVTAVAD
jgi:hypothetical protein